MRSAAIFLALLLADCSNSGAMVAGNAIFSVKDPDRAELEADRLAPDPDLVAHRCGTISQLADIAVLRTRLCSLAIEKRLGADKISESCAAAAAATDEAGDRWMEVVEAPQTATVRACRAAHGDRAKRIVPALSFQIALMDHASKGSPAPPPFHP